jgi:5-formyltetrahydrofolate cyclo-ligase
MGITTKQHLREDFLKRRQALNSEEISQYSKIICAKLIHLQEITFSEIIAGYFPCQNEVDILFALKEFIAMGKRVYLPRYDNKINEYVFSRIHNLKADLVIGKYNILEPRADLASISLDRAKDLIEIWLVPGIVFDRSGHRIGFGSGWYDTFLKNAKGKKLGIAYNWQYIDKIDNDSFDISMQKVITD